MPLASPTASAMTGSPHGESADTSQILQQHDLLLAKPPFFEPEPVHAAGSEPSPFGALMTRADVLVVSDANDVLERNRMPFVSGEPGSGKSHALIHAALRAAKDGCYLPLPTGSLAHSYRDVTSASELIVIETIHCALGTSRQAELPLPSRPASSSVEPFLALAELDAARSLRGRPAIAPASASGSTSMPTIHLESLRIPSLPFRR